ncbi:outer membrane beta-barrel domain-containing protein [Aliikangiella sp. IMCC44359]|uniref:outer membrane beta-barrel domain-containing protein n=1 Tax=Aliikangiella sp. IMCC44359 TaxID=3459125 RepID=UPI00403ACC0F
MSVLQRTLQKIAIGLFCTLVIQNNLIAAEQDVKIIEPETNVVKAQAAAIDTEKLEFGIIGGLLSVEDFDSNLVQGFSFTYHISQDFMLTLTNASSKVGRATFEDVVDGDFLKSADETFKYTSLTSGYKLFHGRSFFSEKSKYNSNVYFVFGLSNVEFANNTETGLILGATYKTVLTDWLTWDLSMKDHIVSRDFIGDDKNTHNIEWSVGLNLLF